MWYKISRLAYACLLGTYMAFTMSSCEQKENAPENEFSYLDNRSDSGKLINLSDEPTEQIYLPGSNDLKFDCEKSNTEVVGVLNKVEFFGPPGYGRTPAKDQILAGHVVKLQKEIEISCSGDKTIVAKDILLEIPADLSYEHLTGATIIVRGQLTASSGNSEKLPITMKVLRMDNIKPVMQ
jgi:hypothetical protein